MGCRIPLFDHKPFVFADEWAEQNMILSNSGRFSYDVTPYFRTPTRCASDPIRHCSRSLLCDILVNHFYFCGRCGEYVFN